MDIHPPGGPAHSLREFAVHILIVTVGILIALALEGVRETWREHTAVAEARKSFRLELQKDKGQLQLEMANVKTVNQDIELAIADFIEAQKSAADLTEEATSIAPSFYFFRTTAWEAALASGVLAHLSEDELTRYADTYLSIKNYQDGEKTTIPDWIALVSWFRSHHTFSAQDRVAGEEKLRTFQMKMQLMQHLANEFSDELKATLH